MELVHYVRDEEADLAKKMEAKLLMLPPTSGVLFAGVSVEPGGKTATTVYRVWIGCSRDVDPRMIPVLVEVTLREEVSRGLVIETDARMGSIRS